MQVHIQNRAQRSVPVSPTRNGWAVIDMPSDSELLEPLTSYYAREGGLGSADRIAQ